MAQFDLLLTQNIAASGVEFTEKTVLAKGSLLSGLATGAPGVLAAGTNGYQLVADSAEATGLKWQAIAAGHTQNTDTGTTSQTYQIHSGSTGPKLKNNSLVLEVRNAADSAYADFKAKNATFDKVTVTAAPSAGTDLTNKTYVDTLVGALDGALVYKGTLGTGGTYTALPTTHGVGWTLRVITAGTYAGVVCEIGDLITSLVARAGTGNTNADWTVAQTNIDGAVTGPAGAISTEEIAVFNSNNRSLKGSGVLLSSLATTQQLGGYIHSSVLSEGTMIYGNQTTGAATALAIPQSTIVGRTAAGAVVTALSATEARAILNVADGATANAKCTGAEINTGTDDVKFATAKAIADSRVVKGPSSAPTADRIVLFDGVTGKLLKQAAVAITDLARWVAFPATKTAAGTLGDIAIDANFFYICTRTGTAGNANWKRTALASNWDAGYNPA